MFMRTDWYVCLTRSSLVTSRTLRVICVHVDCFLLSVFSVLFSFFLYFVYDLCNKEINE